MRSSHPEFRGSGIDPVRSRVRRRWARRLPGVFAAVAFLVACGGAPEAVEPPEMAHSALAESVAADSIREARERFNRAIGERKLAPIEALLLEDFVLITGRSAKFFGAEAYLDLWRNDFASDASMVYVRTPREVRVNEDFGLAEELGDWEGRGRNARDTGGASGVYAAKWQRAEDGRWLLQSEVFTTLECTGEPCTPPDPVEPG